MHTSTIPLTTALNGVFFSVLFFFRQCAYLNNATHNGLPALLDETQGCDVIQDILQITPGPRVGMDSAYGHIALCVHLAKLSLNWAGDKSLAEGRAKSLASDGSAQAQPESALFSRPCFKLIPDLLLQQACTLHK